MSAKRKRTWKEDAWKLAHQGVKNYILQKYLKKNDGTKTLTKSKGNYFIKKTIPITGRRRKAKTKRVKAFVPKVPNTKFTRKVRKVLTSTLPFGDSTTIQYLQVRQVDIDRYRFYNGCAKGYGFVCGNTSDLLNHASMLWNAKALSSDWNSTTGNLSVQTKLNIKSYYVDIFLKSTSSHVVNVEIFECTAKGNNTQTAYTEVVNSSNNMIWRVVDGNGYALQETNGIKPSLYTELLTNWWVKCHRVKLQPGDHTTVTVKVMGPRTFDCSKYLDNGSMVFAQKGMKNFFFKVINDPTVSATTGDVHQWQSNTIGGVAVKFTKHCRMQCPETVAETSQRNAVVVVNDTLATGTSTDQQVVVMNPITTTVNG